MAPISIDVEVASTVPAGKLFKGFFLEIDSIILKVLPQVVASIDVQGDGGVGTIKHVTLKDVGAGKITNMTQRIDAINKEAMTFSYSIIAGDILLGKLESIDNHFTVVPTGEGCILKSTTIYNPIGDEVIPEENIKEAGAFSELIFKSVEAHILANLDAY